VNSSAWKNAKNIQEKFGLIAAGLLNTQLEEQNDMGFRGYFLNRTKAVVLGCFGVNMLTLVIMISKSPTAPTDNRLSQLPWLIHAGVWLF